MVHATNHCTSVYLGITSEMFVSRLTKCVLIVRSYGGSSLLAPSWRQFVQRPIAVADARFPNNVFSRTQA